MRGVYNLPSRVVSTVAWTLLERFLVQHAGERIPGRWMQPSK